MNQDCKNLHNPRRRLCELAQACFATKAENVSSSDDEDEAEEEDEEKPKNKKRRVIRDSDEESAAGEDAESE